jgi:DNA-binding IclR family transcriptional regulator
MRLIDDLTPPQLEVLRAVEWLSESSTSVCSVERIAQETGLSLGEVGQALAVLHRAGFVRLEATSGSAYGGLRPRKPR